MENQHPAAQDHWTPEAYSSAASFVPSLTTKVVKYLNPNPREDILDIGCGDGILTAKIASMCRSIVGLDSSPAFIQSASKNITADYPNSKFYQLDCRHLDTNAPISGHVLANNTYDKVFSNAAMHWILRDHTIRRSFFQDVYRLLKPGGQFVVEQGGAGNVAEVHATIELVLNTKYDIPWDEIQQADPWFFPSEHWMQKALEQAGFEVRTAEIEYRPTKLNPNTEDGAGGLEGWIKLMCAPFLDLLKTSKERQEAVQKVCKALESSITREEDGNQYLGYVRLRVVAQKPD